MVFKKPYAFLIKNFKLIHLGLLALIIFVTIKFNVIVTFFRNFSNNNLKVSEGTGSIYVSSFLYIACLLIIIFAALMFLLMKKKKKPLTFYIFVFCYYILILVMSLMAFSLINSFSSISVGSETSRLYKDLFLLLSFPNYYFIIMSFIRGFGFDVKKFNFNKDLEELEINSEDNEEFEFVLGTDSFKYKRGIHRFFRELKYYFLENKFVISIVLGSILVVILTIIIVNINFVDKKYYKGGTITANGFSYTLYNSYITSKDFNGLEVKDGYKYLLVDFSITNNSTDAQAIKMENSYLNFNGKSIYYKSSIGDVFNDIGYAYTGGVINAGSTKRLLFIFELSSSIKGSNYTFVIPTITGMNDDGTDKYEYYNYNLSPINLDSTVNNEKKNYNEQLFLGKKTFGMSYINIKSAKILSSYEYTYNVCSTSDNKNCQTYYDAEKVNDPSSQKLLVIDYDLNISSDALINNSLNAKVKDKFVFDDFLKIKYKINGRYYNKGIISRINNNVKNKIFMDVSSNIASAKDVQVLIYTRYNHYYIPIK
jgi:hypothetical protein